MPINRELWKPRFNEWPVWPCPTCDTGGLSLVQNSLLTTETGPSEAAHDEPAWEPEWIWKRFSAQLMCGNANCKDIVAVCGKGEIEEYNYYNEVGEHERDYLEHFSPKFFYEAPPVFPIAKACPLSVETELKAAFALIWQDTNSAANRVRSGVEALLTDRKIIQSTKHKRTGKRSRLLAHARIELFAKKNPEAANLLLAIKWIGNEGSHAARKRLQLDDILDGFELFEHVIDLIYVKHAKKLYQRANEINKNKGIAKRLKTARR